MILGELYMNNYDKVINGINLYPVIGNKHINIVFEIDMRKEYKEIFGVDCSFYDFIHEIKSDSFTELIVKEVLYDYYGFKRMRIITDSTYEKWYFVDYIENKYNPYTISFVEKIGCMNKYSMMDDYIDLFNNKIEYKTI